MAPPGCRLLRSHPSALGAQQLGNRFTGKPRSPGSLQRRVHALNADESSTGSNCRQPSDSQHFRDGDSRPVILFDGVCNLCNGGVNFMLYFDTGAVHRMAALQSNAGRELLPCCGRRPDDISSIVLVEPGGCFVKRCARTAKWRTGPLTPCWDDS